MAFGDEGDAALGVPPSAAVRLHVTLDSWIPSDDISKGKDGELGTDDDISSQDAK